MEDWFTPIYFYYFFCFSLVSCLLKKQSDDLIAGIWGINSKPSATQDSRVLDPLHQL